jgi:hypothetical protein
VYPVTVHIAVVVARNILVLQGRTLEPAEEVVISDV